MWDMVSRESMAVLSRVLVGLEHGQQEWIRLPVEALGSRGFPRRAGQRGWSLLHLGLAVSAAVPRLMRPLCFQGPWRAEGPVPLLGARSGAACWTGPSRASQRTPSPASTSSRMAPWSHGARRWAAPAWPWPCGRRWTVSSPTSSPARPVSHMSMSGALWLILGSGGSCAELWPGWRATAGGG